MLHDIQSITVNQTSLKQCHTYDTRLTLLYEILFTINIYNYTYADIGVKCFRFPYLYSRLLYRHLTALTLVWTAEGQY